ncbi:MAG: hypothetical protein GXP13_03790 [Gammaproteobacteria bacterium]|nr:hypothetical protein [Gammaproteobacteria bacterium]
MDELLGFAALTGPLWLLIILLPVSIVIAFMIAKRFKSRRIRITVGFLVFLLVFSVPFGDEIVGRVYLSYLCATEAGVKVYQTIELPEEYWDDTGRPKLKKVKSDIPGVINIVGVNDVFFLKKIFREPYETLLHIDKNGFRLIEMSANKIVGELVYFTHWGGWITRDYSSHNSAVSCEIKNASEWVFNIFRRES